jgi:prepilin-type N-terminal cleavage/methylation domain-containing protein
MFYCKPVGKDSGKILRRTSASKVRDGFSVIELMIALAVVALFTSLALPSYRGLLEKRQVTSGAEQIKAFLSAAQMESVKRNESIAVTYSRSAVDNWCLGMTSGTVACDCTVTDPSDSGACLVDSELRILSNANLTHPGIMNAMNGDGSFAYDPVRGLMLDHTDQFSLQLESPDQTSYALNVEVGVTGQVKICSPSDASAVPGYASC